MACNETEANAQAKARWYCELVADEQLLNVADGVFLVVLVAEVLADEPQVVKVLAADSGATKE